MRPFVSARPGGRAPTGVPNTRTWSFSKSHFDPWLFAQSTASCNLAASMPVSPGVLCCHAPEGGKYVPLVWATNAGTISNEINAAFRIDIEAPSRTVSHMRRRLPARRFTHTIGTFSGPPESIPHMLEVRDLTMRYSGITVVDHVSFAIRRGEILGYLGPNGAGKSTTVKMITGLLEPSRGMILYQGSNIRQDLIA